jgi:hypothetical protein
MTQTRKGALIEQRDKVRAGEKLHTYTLESMFDAGTAYLIKRAHLGFLDAAKALHEELLPGWAVERLVMWPGLPAKVHLWGTHEFRGGRWHNQEDGRVEAESETLARAWLLAILEALIAQEPDT